MAVPKTIANAVGSWTGDSTLHMSWMPEGQRLEKGPSKLHVDLNGDSAFATLVYTWTYKGKQQEGQMLIASGKSETTIGWVDSWHQNTSVMLLRGESADDPSCRGTYKVEGHPDWHWRIAIERNGEKLSLKMFNISPDGMEEPAVEGVYTKE